MKLSHSIMIAASLMTMFSCSKENIMDGGNELQDKGEVLTAVTPGPETRVQVGAISNGNAPLYWSAGDSFIAFNPSKEQVAFTLATGAGAAKGTFSSKKTVPGINTAVFPESVKPAYNGEVLEMTLPATYTAAENSENLPMLGTIDAQKQVRFQHLTAMMRVELTGLPAGYKSIRITAGSPIAGKFVLDKGALVPAADNADPANKTVTVDLKEGLNYTFLPLPAGTYPLSVSAVAESGRELLMCSFPAKTIACGKMISVKRPVNLPQTDVNLAKGMKASASSNSVAVGNAVYGDVAFIWQAAGNKNEWFEVELAVPTVINHVVLKWDLNAYARYCEIQVSQDGKNYETVYTVKKWNSAPTDGVMVLPFGKEVVAKYVKAVLKEGATEYNMTIQEFEIYNSTKNMNLSPKGVNLALNKYAEASSAFYPVENLVEGNKGFAWAAKNCDEQTVIVDMGTVHQINNVDLYWQTANYASATVIKVSVDGVNYTPVKTVTGWKPMGTAACELQNLAFNLVEARYVMALVQAGTSNPVYCAEFEIYNR